MTTRDKGITLPFSVPIISVKDAAYGAKGDGVTNDTSAIQAAINATSATGAVLFFPSGTYLVTDTLNLPNKTQLAGEHKSTGTTGSTRINFAPTSQRNLFAPTGLPTTFRDGYSIENLYITGNSTNAAGFSDVSIYVDNITKSSFKNLRISGFRTGVQCLGTINNRFEFIEIDNCYIQSILYSGSDCTTDVWEQCYLSSAPIGVQTSGSNLGIRFNNTIIESITTYGVNLVKESYGWSFTNTYSEDTPSANVATNALFRVGFDGTVLAGTAQLSIDGGYMGGRNAGGVGALLDVDYTDGIFIGGFIAARFTYAVRTSANTQTNQIVSSGWTSAQIGTQVSDTTKIFGEYPIGVFNSGTRNAQASNLFSVNLLGTLTVRSGASAGTSTELILGNSNGTTVGAAGGASALPATPLGYIIAYLGAQQIKIPYYLP